MTDWIDIAASEPEHEEYVNVMTTEGETACATFLGDDGWIVERELSGAILWWLPVYREGTSE